MPGLHLDQPGQVPAQTKIFNPVPKLNLLVTFVIYHFYSLLLDPPYMLGCPVTRGNARIEINKAHKFDKF